MLENIIITLLICSTEEEKLYFEVSLSLLKKVSTWNPELSAVPLSMSDAIQIGRAEAYRNRPQFNSYICIAASIQSLQPHPKPFLWYWHIVFVPVIDQHICYLDRSEIVLLLDGTVIEPKVINISN
ncbi:hypothetical protein [Nostoc sp. GT001]|uniref:hypothetical protein n=1 Tax=Nostoc sp. GT001 TaxID=3056647 RepID=UPI0025AAA314|nr:hypothetical protein [Nostoc sp. GT001]MDM9580072.1 hypothetical protein [Nostoc sp. GT001]